MQERRSRRGWGALAPPPQNVFRKIKVLQREESLQYPPPPPTTSSHLSAPHLEKCSAVPAVYLYNDPCLSYLCSEMGVTVNSTFLSLY